MKLFCFLHVLRWSFLGYYWLPYLTQRNNYVTIIDGWSLKFSHVFVYAGFRTTGWARYYVLDLSVCLYVRSLLVFTAEFWPLCSVHRRCLMRQYSACTVHMSDLTTGAALANKTETTGIVIITRWSLENNLNVWRAQDLRAGGCILRPTCRRSLWFQPSI